MVPVGRLPSSRRGAEIVREQLAFLGGLSAPGLKRPRSTYHRGQVASLLRQLGITPPPTDYLVFFDEGMPAPAAYQTRDKRFNDSRSNS